MFENTMLEMVAAERESGSSHATDMVDDIVKHANRYNRSLDDHSVAVEENGESFDGVVRKQRASTRRRRRSKPKRTKTTRKKNKKKKSKKKRRRR